MQLGTMNMQLSYSWRLCEEAGCCTWAQTLKSAHDAPEPGLAREREGCQGMGNPPGLCEHPPVCAAARDGTTRVRCPPSPAQCMMSPSLIEATGLGLPQSWTRFLHLRGDRLAVYRRPGVLRGAEGDYSSVSVGSGGGKGSRCLCQECLVDSEAPWGWLARHVLVPCGPERSSCIQAALALAGIGPQPAEDVR